MGAPGQILILNGAPRAGKSSIARAIQQSFDGIWLNPGVDAFMPTQPAALQPGIGLRPGGERPDLETHIPDLYAALYHTIAAQSRLGFNLVVDTNHHDFYSRPLDIMPRCAGILACLPVLFVGVTCPIDMIMARRDAGTGQTYLRSGADGDVPAPVLRWQEAVHRSWRYDLTVDTGATSAEACAAVIGERLAQGPGTAFVQLAGL